MQVTVSCQTEILVRLLVSLFISYNNRNTFVKYVWYSGFYRKFDRIKLQTENSAFDEVMDAAPFLTSHSMYH